MFLAITCQHAPGACQSHSCPGLSLHEASRKYVELSHSTLPFLTLRFHKKDLTPTSNLLPIWPILPPYGHILSVGHKVTRVTLYKGYFCTNFYIRWSLDITSQSTTIQTTNKHHHHGDKAACPSSGVDLMIPRRPRGKPPCACSFQGHCQRVLFDLLN
jgi:hypothetical protein